MRNDSLNFASRRRLTNGLAQHKLTVQLFTSSSLSSQFNLIDKVHSKIIIIIIQNLQQQSRNTLRLKKQQHVTRMTFISEKRPPS